MAEVIRYSEKPTIFGTGLIALDIVIGSDENESAHQWAGGTCGNVLTILSYLGWSSFPIARLNNESSSLRVKADMKKWGVRRDFLELEPTASVPVITQEITRDVNGLPVHKFHWKNCPKCGSWLPNYKAVTLKGTSVVKERVLNKGDVFFFDRVSPGALDLARHFKVQGSIIFFEPSAKGDPKQFAEAVKLADIIKYSDQRFVSELLESDKKQSPFLEIQTLGGNGVQYRHTGKAWKQLSAFETEELNDTCGCGDWTTAGIISKLCAKGHQQLFECTIDSIESALKYGQALGAWNCSFEGARSGMYQVDKRTFNREVAQILKDGTQKARESVRKTTEEYASDGLCPLCPNE